MMSRFLGRLAVVWIVGWGCLIVLGLAMGGTFERGAWMAIPLVVLGPPAFMLLLAWVFAPRRP
jgi:hypothetical protein